MGMTNAAKQAAHRARLKSRGLVHLQVWASPDQAHAIRAILSGEALTVPLPIRRQAKRKKKLSAEDEARLQVTDRNRLIINQHRAAVEKMEADRVSRSEMCGWLELRGADFGGKATALNAMLGPRVFK